MDSQNQELVVAAPQAVVVSAPVADPLVAAIADMAKAGTNVDQLRELMAMRRELRAERAEEGYVTAMATFKRNPPRIEKTRRANVSSKKGEGASYAYKYANLADVCEKIIAGLAAVGISHSWSTRQQDGSVEVSCTLTHEMGHSKSTKLASNLDTSGGKNPIQALGSAVSYLERYTLLAACGMAVDDEQDDDGYATGGERAEMRAAAQDMRQPRQKPDPRQIAEGHGKHEEAGASLIKDARSKAAQGHAVFGPFFRGLSEASRKSLMPHMDELTAAADSARAPQEGA